MKQIKLNEYIQDYPVGDKISSYFQTCKNIAEIIKREFPNKSITFCCMGSSGSIIAALVCQHLDIANIYHFKKQGENAHYKSIDNYNEINIIIDDLMASGDTVEIIYSRMKKEKMLVDAVVMTGDLKINKLIKIINSEIPLIVGGNIF